MEDSRPKYFTPGRVLLSLVATGLVFIFWVVMLTPFQFEWFGTDGWPVKIYAAICMSGGFFLAFNMVMVVFLDPRGKDKNLKAGK